MTATETQSTDISILVPFDIGNTYVFKGPKDLCEPCIWKNIFTLKPSPDWSWSTRRLGEKPAFYSEPFGPIARYMPSAIKDLDGLCGEGKFLASYEIPEIIFFPRGIGILVLRLKAKGSTDSDWRENFKKVREDLKRALGNAIKSSQGAYRDTMKAAMAHREFGKFVHKIDLPGRRDEIDEVRFPYAIAFIEGNYPVRNPNEKRVATLSKPHPIRYRYVNHKAGTEIDPEEVDVAVCIDVGWGESAVYSEGETNWMYARGAVEDAFTAAMASWFALVLMSSLVSQSLRDSFVDLANNHRKLSDKEGQKIRLAFMDTSNASRPVRWTFRERDIILLDVINETWTTERWWKSLEERTVLLTTRHNEVATERRRNAEKKLATLVIGLATLTALTAIRDVADTIISKEDGRGWVLTAMVMALLVAVIIWFWARSDEKEQEQ